MATQNWTFGLTIDGSTYRPQLECGLVAITDRNGTSKGESASAPSPDAFLQCLLDKKYLMSKSETQTDEANVIRPIIKKLGLNVHEIQIITNSFSSLVCRLILRTGAGPTLKIPFSREKAIREVRSLNRLKHLPNIPRVYELIDTGISYALLMETLPGSPLVSGSFVRHGILESIGETLANIHSVCDADDIIDFANRDWWREKLKADTYKRLCICKRWPDVDWESVDRLHAKYLASVSQDQHPSFVHADFRLGNLLEYNGALSGIVDFESSHTGSAHVDLIRISNEFGGLQSRKMKSLLAGYRKHLEPPGDLTQMLPFYQFHHSIACVAWAISHDQSTTNFFRSHLSAIARKLECARFA
jgi:aminoglycoside phosphotransferase (APT) family kinase protein